MVHLAIMGKVVSIPTDGLTPDEAARFADGLTRSVQGEQVFMEQAEWEYVDYTDEEMTDHLVDYAYACGERLRQSIVSGRVAE